MAKAAVALKKDEESEHSALCTAAAAVADCGCCSRRSGVNFQGVACVSLLLHTSASLMGSGLTAAAARNQFNVPTGICLLPVEQYEATRRSITAAASARGFSSSSLAFPIRFA